MKISRRIDSFLRHDQDRHRTVHQFLHIFDSLSDRLLTADQGSDQLRRIDLSAAHLEEMCSAVFIRLVKDFLLIIDLADCCDRKASQMGLEQQRLGLIV